MSVQQMRAAIYEVYSGRRWKIKVQNMSDAQVIAVYYSFLEKGKFLTPGEDRPWNEKPTEPYTPEVLSDLIDDVETRPSYVGEQLKIDI